ncbi:MAG: anaerobic ribonucleoside-triphosphate reductase activating protein [Bacilli bacterium]|nr:anaerobic ribonucleoside-triphosphate reductase activating protein [Bacilli bacterium]
MNYNGIINCSIVDGNGFRVSLFISGCKHYCKFCQNKHTWNFKSGKPYNDKVEEVLFDRINKPFIKGLTLTGGDPLYSDKEIYNLLIRFREKFGKSKDVWLYTGFTYEYCIKNFKHILDLVDYLVDGHFDITKRDISLKFRGSSNQIIWEKDEDGKWFKSELNN